MFLNPGLSNILDVKNNISSVYVLCLIGIDMHHRIIESSLWFEPRNNWVSEKRAVVNTKHSKEKERR